ILQTDARANLGGGSDPAPVSGANCTSGLVYWGSVGFQSISLGRVPTVFLGPDASRGASFTAPVPRRPAARARGFRRPARTGSRTLEQTTAFHSIRAAGRCAPLGE